MFGGRFPLATRIDVHGDATALAGILVKLSADAKKPSPLSAVSDADGHFQFTGLSAGSYLLEVSLDGFKPFTDVIVLQPTESRIQDIRLELATVAVMRSFTILVTNGSFITISGAAMSGPRPVRTPTPRSPTGSRLPTHTASVERLPLSARLCGLGNPSP